MVSPLVSRAPQCISCIRRLSGSVGGSFNVHAGQQVRGKKKLAKVSTIRVQLLQNVPGYGRRGAVIPVTAGGIAQYVTASNLQALGVKKDAPLERDSTFRSTTEKKLERQVEEEEPEQVVDETQEEEFRPTPIVPAPSIIQAEPRAPQIELDLMSPDRATSILEDLLPPNLDFYRTTITVPTKKISPSISSSSAIAAAAQAAKADSNKIHGSVSTSDIAANLKAILAEDEQGARVVVSPEQISFVQKTDEKDRVKQLGVFEIQIRLEGASDSVRRTVQVHAQS
ncbi:uncharacterized protein PAC_11899 [Phialocephala subalpina]|uniref:Ribosomal protein L9 domain-containing protein n=1 Tax=Phialocephala subalpina TaxID=576137 RepID=A0A1L7XAF5_9HELO|nr:uncharacterized protein PAC_11899 [Phialocephala subalpina]